MTSLAEFEPKSMIPIFSNVPPLMQNIQLNLRGDPAKTVKI